MSDNKKIPKRHKRNLGDRVYFVHAGSVRKGTITELTKESNGHATYTVEGDDSKIYPCLGVDQSKPTMYIITK